MESSIVITGIGVISPIGQTRDEYKAALLSGMDGRQKIKRFDVNHEHYVSQSGAVLNVDEQRLAEMDPSKLGVVAVAAAMEAVEQAGLKTSDYDVWKAGVSVGTSHGGNHALLTFLKQRLNLLPDEPNYSLLLSTSPVIGGKIAAQFDFRGPVLTVSTACSSSTSSVGIAMDYLRSGQADVMIAGGVDLFSELTFSGFNCLKALSPDESKPLSKHRKGLLLGEGAAMFVLERADRALRRKAPILAELCGYAISNEAYHETAPDPSGINARLVMRKAIEHAGLSISDIDYVNLHGTGTQANDPMELAAVADLFGEKLQNMKVSSTKSMIGHTLGAAGSMELAATVLCMNEGFIPPTIHFDEPIENFEQVDVVPNKAVPFNGRIALSNSFAFAGHLASIVIKKTA